MPSKLLFSVFYVNPSLSLSSHDRHIVGQVGLYKTSIHGCPLKRLEHCSLSNQNHQIAYITNHLSFMFVILEVEDKGSSSIFILICSPSPFHVGISSFVDYLAFPFKMHGRHASVQTFVMWNVFGVNTKENDICCKQN
ncbi:hypothetical protein O6H91_16G002000 [Diphasiastrum complanatum]|uniref:Uncharacterized protein n=1 Tax=Diphasiastrum complanatum TaxID=34168 RepID=A0ACC2B989_DIPCM|nr:hypothetical protein O6H91_16G002000 [Diphasiastrum complanatum]